MLQFIHTREMNSSRAHEREMRNSSVHEREMRNSCAHEREMRLTRLRFPGWLFRAAAVFFSCLLLLTCASCAAGGGIAEPDAEPVRQGTLPAPSVPSEEERLVIYTSHKEALWQPIIKEFEFRTGIWVQVETGGTNELLKRLEEEQGKPVCDVLFGGGVESLMDCADLFEPYRAEGSEEVLEDCLSPQALFTPFSALPIVLVRNPLLVGEEDLKGFSDLFTARYKGRIAFADPQNSSSSYTALVTVRRVLQESGRLTEPERDEFLISFASQLAGVELSSSGEVLSAVSDGSAEAGITLEETALTQIASGGSLDIVYPEEGTSAVPDGSALVKGAPHPENAKRFLDFTLSREVQELLPKRFFRRPVLAGIDETALSGGLLPKKETLKLLDYDEEAAAAERKRTLISWAFYFGADPEAEENGGGQ